MFRTCLIELAKDIKFQILDLNCSLNHVVGNGHITEVSCRFQSAENCFGFCFIQFVFSNTSIQILLYNTQTFCGAFFVDITHDNIESTRSCNLGNAAAHLARSDYSKCFNLHNFSSPSSISIID